ncbi:hypothetical protein [Paenarthrobacter nitroguajacolicus]|uniref:hypothetical protein n=1 Tax=Paenarthrobacter nitroguajacolicus TaxID=211146 RepID=UPI0015B8F5B4|nr:hypothetical protein [Paenarthrobacter nitroguajacolicus]NWL34468.1 hypothetical protein [Paenarthrobacter nitroguajacolicus]
MSNPHFERATKRLHDGTNNEVVRAQAEATLALAYEQRTANLIALFSEGFAGRGIDYAGLETQIRERLGLS